MPEDLMSPDEDQEEAGPVVHDDIMKRLLDYQRQLREGPEAENARPLVDYSQLEAQEANTAVATVTAEGVVDLTRIEDAGPEVIEIPEAEAVEAGEPSVRTTPEPEASAEPTPPEASEVTAEPDAIVEIAEAAPAAGRELAERVERLEAAIEKVVTMLAAARSDFQDLAIRADERIAQIEDVLAEVRGSRA